jgi:hypothetical protein
MEEAPSTATEIDKGGIATTSKRLSKSPVIQILAPPSIRRPGVADEVKAVKLIHAYDRPLP